MNEGILLEGENGERPIGFVTLGIDERSAPEVVVEEVPAAAAAALRVIAVFDPAGHVLIPTYGAEVIVDEVTLERVAVDTGGKQKGNTADQPIGRLPSAARRRLRVGVAARRAPLTPLVVAAVVVVVIAIVIHRALPRSHLAQLIKRWPISNDESIIQSQRLLCFVT